MDREFCKDCVCLIDNAGEWACDEKSMNIDTFNDCPESAE